MLNLPAHTLDYALAGMAYPARYWQILAWADYNCASGKLRKALWQLPDRTYLNRQAIVAALWEQPGGAAVCGPPPPPRTAVPAHPITRAHRGHSRTHAEVRWIA
jgi:hypothetical protein